MGLLLGAGWYAILSRMKPALSDTVVLSALVLALGAVVLWLLWAVVEAAIGAAIVGPLAGVP